MKKRIRIKFIDGWKGWVKEDYHFYNLLSSMYDLELVDKNPDYVFSIGVGFGDTDFLYPDAVKIVYIGENRTPDFNRFDYAIGFDHLSFGDRYLRYPLYLTYSACGKIVSGAALTDSQLLDRKFCSFVVSNRHGDDFRCEFFERLSKYRRVDSGGRVLNNIGGRIGDKHEFCSQYKFNIAFENSVYPGYTTEKPVEALAANSVPIYYGDPLVAAGINPEAMVIVRSREDMERAIEEIIRLDNDDAAYLKKCRTPKLALDPAAEERKARAFLANIFDPPPAEAKRLARFGSQANYRRDLGRVYSSFLYRLFK